MNEALDRPGEVKAGAELSQEALAAWLKAHDLGALAEVKQFGRGYSNLTYLVRVLREGSERDLILRTPPRGVKIASAHDMGREVRILRSLGTCWDKVPRTLGYEESEAVLGVPFYVMERVAGVIFRAQGPKSLPLAPLDGHTPRFTQSMSRRQGLPISASRRATTRGRCAVGASATRRPRPTRFRMSIRS